MATRLIHKKSSVAAKVPNPSDLQFGELAINYTDGRIYFKDSNSEIQAFDRVDTYITGGTGVSVSDGEVSIGQDVSTGASVEFDTVAAVTGDIDVLRTDDGTQANPSYTFGTDLDTGLYRRSDNSIGLTVGGSDGWVIGESTEDEADFVVFGILQAPELNMIKKNIPTGTTGNAVVNNSAGSVNLDAGDTSLTVTNNLVNEDSIVIGTVGTNDATTTSVQIVSGSGEFVIYPNAAPTAETKVNFMVVN